MAHGTFPESAGYHLFIRQQSTALYPLCSCFLHTFLSSSSSPLPPTHISPSQMQTTATTTTTTNADAIELNQMDALAACLNFST